MKEDKKSRNPFHGFLDRLKGKRESDVPSQSALGKVERVHGQSEHDVAKDIPLQTAPTAQNEIPASNPAPQSFWEQAAEKLDPKVRHALDEARGSSLLFGHDRNEDSKDITDTPSLPEIVEREAQKRLEDMEHRQWALPIGVAGKTISIRTLLGKFITLAKLVKNKGDAFIELDPTGYAKLAWLPFSLLVDLSAVDLEQHQAALDAFSEISFLLYRYAQVESIYHERSNKEPKFEECLVELYYAVLECEVALLHHFCRHGFLRFLRAIPALDGWQDRVTSINHLDQRCQSLVDIHVASDILYTRRDVEELLEAKRRKEINDILEWIIDHDPLVQRKLVLEKLGKTHSNIGEWLFEHEAFKSWLEGDSVDSPRSRYSQLLWLHGPVGCGKTSLTTRIIEYFLEQASAPKPRDEQVSYFYCAKTHGSGSKPLEIFQSMVRQLAWSRKDSHIEKCIKDTWASRQSSKTDRLSLEDCKTLLLQLIPRFRKTILIIDGLDECDNPQIFLEALNDLSGSFQKIGVSVNIFVSSRDDVQYAVTTTFSEYLAINITSSATEPDLRRYVERRVDEECRHFPRFTKRETPSILQRLVDELTERGQLAFRWTELQLALFFPSGRPFNPVHIRRRLEGLQERTGLLDLNNTYKEIYEHKIFESSTRKDELHFLLKWALACTVNIPIKLLTETIKFHLEQQGEMTDHIDNIYILDLASNLLVIDEDDTVQFAHISVKEYFQVTTDFANEFSKPETNNQVAETCLQYLLSAHENFPKYNPYDLIYGRIEGKFTFYALTRWALHYARSEELREEMRSSTVYFEKFIPGAFASEEFIAWVLTSIDWDGFHIDDVHDALSTPPCPLFLSCIWGFMKVVHDTIEHEPDLLKALNHDGKNGLHLAAYYNQIDVVKALLRTDIEVNQADDVRGRTALQHAIIRGNIEVVKVLLSERGDVNVDIQDKDGFSAIHHAVSGGQVEITRILLDCRKNLDIHAVTYVDWDSDSPGRMPLHLAIAKGNLDVVRILLENRSDIQINLDCVDGPPLCIAANLGYVDIIDMLFKKRNDISIDQKDNFGRTALHIACMNGHVAVVRALLQKDSKFPVNNVNDYGRTALHYAARDGHGEVVQALLDGRDDLDVDIQDHGGCTALHLAAESDHTTVIETLLRKRETIQVNITQSKGRTALQLASEARNAGAITALLSNSNSIDTGVQDLNGYTALHLACESWSFDAVKALLDGCKDLKLNKRNKEGKTALHLAVENGYLTIVEQLAVRPDIDPNIADDDGLTVLHVAALRGNAKILKSIVGCPGRVDINTRNKQEQTALHLTLDHHSPHYYYRIRDGGHRNSADCVQVLLDNDIDITSQDEMGKTALYVAAEGGHSKAVMMLLDKCKDTTLNERDEDGWTILHWAVHHNDTTVVERVVGQWPDIVNIADKEGQSALLVAAAKERWPVIQVLLDRCPCIEIEAVNTADGWTVLHLAAQYENTDVIRELLRRQPKLMSMLDSKGRTALHIACSRGQAETVQTLLDEQPTININAVDKESGCTALHFAVEKKSTRAVRVLLDTRPDIDINIADLNGRTAAQVAVTESDTATLQVLLGKRKDTYINHADNEGRTALHLTGQKFRSGFVLMLLENAADLAINAKDKYGQTALYGMLENGLFRQVGGKKWVNETGLVVRVLLEKYKDLFEINECDLHGRTVTHLAAHFGRLDALRAIVEICSDVDFNLADKDGRTVLHYAASRGRMDDIITGLEKRGESDAEDEDEDIWEALDDSDSEEESESDSEERGNLKNDDEWGDGTQHCVKVLSLLLEKCNHGILNAKDKQGLTAFHIASIAGDGAIVEKLLSEERDIDVNARDVYGWNALHMAVFHRCTRVVETLLTKCSLLDINIQDQRGQTPLHLAASRGYVKIVKALLENGRNINLDLKDEEQRTALDLAEEGNHAQVVDMLKAANGHGSIEDNASG